MATFNPMVITTQGDALITKAIGGLAKVNFTHSSISTTDYSSSSTEALKALTAVTNIMQTVEISGAAIVSPTEVKITSFFTNAGVTTGYALGNLTIYATDPDEGEILFAIAPAQPTFDTIPPFANGGASIIIGSTITLDDASVVNINVTTEGIVTADQLNDYIPKSWLGASSAEIALNPDKEIPLVGTSNFGSYIVFNDTGEYMFTHRKGQNNFFRIVNNIYTRYDVPEPVGSLGTPTKYCFNANGTLLLLAFENAQTVIYSNNNGILEQIGNIAGLPTTGFAIQVMKFSKLKPNRLLIGLSSPTDTTTQKLYFYDYDESSQAFTAAPDGVPTYTDSIIDVAWANTENFVPNFTGGDDYFYLWMNNATSPLVVVANNTGNYTQSTIVESDNLVNDGNGDNANYCNLTLSLNDGILIAQGFNLSDTTTSKLYIFRMDEELDAPELVPQTVPTNDGTPYISALYGNATRLIVGYNVGASDPAIITEYTINTSTATIEASRNLTGNFDTGGNTFFGIKPNSPTWDLLIGLDNSNIAIYDTSSFIGVATLGPDGKVPIEQLPEGIGGGGSTDFGKVNPIKLGFDLNVPTSEGNFTAIGIGRNITVNTFTPTFSYPDPISMQIGENLNIANTFRQIVIGRNVTTKFYNTTNPNSFTSGSYIIGSNIHFNTLGTSTAGVLIGQNLKSNDSMTNSYSGSVHIGNDHSISVPGWGAVAIGCGITHSAANINNPNARPRNVFIGSQISVMNSAYGVYIGGGITRTGTNGPGTGYAAPVYIGNNIEVNGGNPTGGVAIGTNIKTTGNAIIVGSDFTDGNVSMVRIGSGGDIALSSGSVQIGISPRAQVLSNQRTSYNPDFLTAIGCAIGTTGIYSTLVGYGANSFGCYSTAMGYRATATNNSVAIGSYTTAGYIGHFDGEENPENAGYEILSSDAIAIGHNSVAQGCASIAIGYRARVGSSTIEEPAGNFSISIGSNSLANNSETISIGNQAQTNISESIVIGGNSRLPLTNGNSVIAIGYNIKGSSNGGNRQIFIGSNINACNSYTPSLVIGHVENNTYAGMAPIYGVIISPEIVNITSVTAYSVVVGANTRTGGNGVSIGYNAGGTGANAVSIGGHSNTGTTVNSVAVGYLSRTSTSSVTIGAAANSSAANTVTVGRNAISTAQGAIAIGFNSASQGTETTALGIRSTVSGNGGTAIGRSAHAAETSTALGSVSNAGGPGSIAVGVAANSSGTNCVAVGPNAIATGFNGIAIGADAQADSNVTIGRSATSVNGDIAIGRTARATGLQALAVGTSTSATHDYSAAIGPQSTATATNMIRIGSSTITLIQGQVGFTAASDERDKIDFKPVESALTFIEKLNPVTYNLNPRNKYIEEATLTEEEKEQLAKYGITRYNKEEHLKGTKAGSRRRVGFKAQEVYEALKNHYGSDNYADVVHDTLHDLENVPNEVESQYSMTYDTLIPFIVKAMQEQQEEIKALKEQVRSFKS